MPYTMPVSPQVDKSHTVCDACGQRTQSLCLGQYSFHSLQKVEGRVSLGGQLYTRMIYPLTVIQSHKTSTAETNFCTPTPHRPLDQFAYLSMNWAQHRVTLVMHAKQTFLLLRDVAIYRIFTSVLLQYKQQFSDSQAHCLHD